MSHAATFRGLALLLALAACHAVAAPKSVQAFNTYEASPFLIADKQGLVPELVEQLNQLLNEQYRLRLRNLPRARLLQQYLDEPAHFDGVVMLLSPAFVNDRGRRTYLWSKPLFEDYNVLVLRAAEAPALLDDHWLAGKRLLTVRGQRLPLLDELVASGQLRRENFNSELQTLQMVAAGRGDFTHMNHLMFQHLSRQYGLDKQLKAFALPGDAGHFSRHILIGQQARELLEPLNAAIDALQCQPRWHETATHYGFAALPCTLNPEPE